MTYTYTKQSKLVNALLGFAVGIFTLPIAAAAWPFAAACEDTAAQFTTPRRQA